MIKIWKNMIKDVDMIHVTVVIFINLNLVDKFIL